MSKFIETNGEWTLAYGVDHANGAFVMVLNETIDRDVAVLAIDSMGVRVSQRARHGLTPREARLIASFITRFAFARAQGNERPNLGIDDIAIVAAAFGFTGDRLWQRIARAHDDIDAVDEEHDHVLPA